MSKQTQNKSPTEKDTIPQIKEGYLNTFFIFKLYDLKDENHLTYLEAFAKRKLIISSESPRDDLKGIDIDFQERFTEFLKYRMDLFKKHLNKELSLPENFVDDFVVHPSTISSENIKVNFIEDKLAKTQSLHLEFLASTNTLEYTYTNLAPTHFKNRLLIHPFRFTKNSNSNYSGVTINIYKNGLGIINISLPIDGVSFNELSETMLNINLDRVLVPEFLIGHSEKRDYVECGAKSINEVGDLYIKYLQKFYPSLSSEVHRYYHITLLDYDTRPQNFSGMSKESIENIFKLLCAPISKYTARENDEMKKILSDQSFSMSKYKKFYISTTARSLSVFNSDYERLGLDNNSFYITSLNGIIPCIEYLLLKKYTDREFLFYDLDVDMSGPQLRKLKRKMFDNDAFFLSRHVYNYGSLKRLLEFMLKTCEDFNDQEFVDDRRKQVEELVKLRIEETRNNFTFLMGILGSMITLLLSLSSIEKVLDILSSNGFPRVGEFTIWIWLVFFVIEISLIYLIFRDRIKIFVSSLWRKIKNH